MVLTLAPYKPLSKISDITPGGVDHPAGKGMIDFNLRVLTRYGEVLIDFGQFQDLLSWRDSLSVEGASGSWTIKMRASLCNENLLKKLHPGLVVEAYCARNDDPLIGVIRDPSKIKRIDTTPKLPEFAQVPATSGAGGGAIGIQNGAKPANEEATVKLILAECARQGVTDQNQIAYILATAQHESKLTPIEEYDSGADYNGRKDLGNTQPGDGPRYKGRGYVQITGRANYKKYSELTGQDLVGNPSLALNENVAAFILVHGMRTGNFTGAKVSDYIGGGKTDFYGARDTVNGNSDKADLIAGYAKQWQTKLPQYNTGTPAAAGPVQPAPTGTPPAARPGYTAKMYDSTTDVVITKYSQMSRHHQNRGTEAGRKYVVIAGKEQEVTPSPAGYLIKKDYVLEAGPNERHIPKFVGVSGYVGEVGGYWGCVTVYADKARTQLIAQFLHMDNISVKTGDTVQAGQQIGRQSNVGMEGGAIHSHDEYRLEDWDRAIAIQNSGGNGSIAGGTAPVAGGAAGGGGSGFGLAAGQNPIGPAVEPIDDPYLDKCPHLLMRGVIGDYGRSTDDSTSLTISGESYGAIYKDCFMLVDLQAPELASQSLEWRASSQVPLGVSYIYYTILNRWVENFWGQTTGWEARTRQIPFPPNYMTRINSEGSAWSNLQWLSIEGFFHIFVDHTGAICWEKLPWSSKARSLIAGRNWEDLQMIDIPSWKIKNWNDRLSQQGVSNFIRCISTMQGQTSGGDRVGAPSLIYNMGSIRQYGGPTKREINFPVGTGGEADQYYTSATTREGKATINTFTALCALECVRWYDRPVQRCGVNVRGESAWRINTRVRLAENWHCPDAKPAEYYVVSRSHMINIANGSWDTQLELVRDRRTRYLGIGVGDVPIVLDPKAPIPDAKVDGAVKSSALDSIIGKGASSDAARFTGSTKLTPGTPVASLKNYKPPDKDGNLTVVEIPAYLRVPLVPDEYFFFDRLSAKVVPIGNDPYAYAQKEVIPKMGEKDGGKIDGPISAVGTGPKTIVGKKNEAIAKAATDLGAFSAKEEGPVQAVNKVFEKAEVILPWDANADVPKAESALKLAGITIPENQTKPGDIAILGDAEHIGIVLEDGSTKIRSKSAAKGTFGWDAD